MITLSSFSCLSVVSFAAIVDEDAEYDENGELVQKFWDLDDTGLLTVYASVGEPTWSDHAADIKEVVVEATAKSICDFAFSEYPQLSKVTFKGNLTSIGNYAFQNCDALAELNLPIVEAIGDYAFYDCDTLTDVVFNGGLSVVGKNLLKSCDSLKTVKIANGVVTIGEGMFEDCAALEKAVLPDSIESIGRLAFENCSSLAEIVIPDSTTTIGEYAFYGCSAAKSAYIGHNVNDIGEYAFGKCTALESVQIECAMPVISEGMFFGCSSLAGLANLPEGIKTIGKNAFKECSSFAEITIPATVTTIGDSAFDATALTTIDIPASVEEIGAGAFTNCDQLEEINVDPKNRNYASVDGVLYNAYLTVLICCPAGKSGAIVVNEGAEKIGDDAFIGCTAVETVEIPKSVTSIANNAFNGCSDSLVIVCDCDSYAAAFAKVRGIETELNHVASASWQITAEADCINAGSKELVCTGCGYAYETVVIDALGHSYNSEVTLEATCETDGVETFTCTRTGCQDTYTKVIPATGHDYDDGVVTKAATCEANGVKTFTCQNCGTTYTEDVPAIGHDYDDGVVTKEATCEEDGVKTFTCKNDCGASYTEVIPAIGHDYDEGVVTTEATCGVAGVMTYTCKNGCGTTYTEEIPALSHNYTETVIREGYCISKGIVEYNCENCGDSYTVKEFGDHQLYSYTVTVEPTCEEEGKSGSMCALCREFVGEVTVTPAKGHTEGKWTTEKKATCTAAGSKTKKCTDCGIVLATEAVEATGHTEGSWIVDKKATVEAEGKKHKECKVCGETIKTATIAQLKCARPEVEKVSNISKGVKVTWNKVKGADSYRVYRKTKNSDWKYIDSTTKTSYTDDTAKSGTKYYYAVRARNEAGNSALSNSLSRYYLEDPTLKSATSTKKGIVLKWSEVAGAEGYIVYRKTGSGSFERIKLEDGVSNTSFTDKTAQKGVKYTYKVKAYFSKTSSDYSRTRIVTDKY